MSTNRILLIVSGVLLVAGGVLSILLPFAASLAAALIVGWTFILSGVLHVVWAFRTEEERWWNAGFGVLIAIAGLSFVFNPLAGMVSLAILLGALFLVSGAMQLWLAWKRRQTDSVWVLAISGAISLVLGLLIAFNLFTAAATVPGILLGIELISTGLAFLFLKPQQIARGMERAATERDGA